MKKIIVLMLVLAICICMVGCNQTKMTEEKNKTTQVQLTHENMKDYFSIELETENYVCDVTEVLGYKFADGTADCVIRVSKIAPCTPSNVVIELKVCSVTPFWNETAETVKINVPVDDTATKRISVESDGGLPGLLDKPTFYYEFVSISGSVEVAV